MSDVDLAQLIAGGAVAGLVLLLGFVGRKDTVVKRDTAYDVDAPPDLGATRPAHVACLRRAGSVVPKGEVAYLPAATPTAAVRRTWLSAIIVGKDHRVSTSKTIAFAWMMAIAFGLLTLVVAVWLGDHGPWDAQEERGLQEEYLLLLGGPYAAAILAKVTAVNRSDVKPEAGVGDSNPLQVVTDDEGSTDLGDFQYVIFNGIALAFFLGDFIGDGQGGFPVLPDLLTALALTSAAGYSARKLIAERRPKLISVIPASAAAGSTVEVFGTNLVVPATVSRSGEDLPPVVTFGAERATVTAKDMILGNDRLTVMVPEGVAPGSAPIAVARADGVPAQTTAGTAVIAFDVIAPPATEPVVAGQP